MDVASTSAAGGCLESVGAVYTADNKQLLTDCTRVFFAEVITATAG